MANLLKEQRVVASTGKRARSSSSKANVNAIAAVYLAFANYVRDTLTPKPWLTLDAVNANTVLTNASKSKAVDAAVLALEACAALPTGSDESEYCAALASFVREHRPTLGDVTDGLVYVSALGEHRPAIVTVRQLGSVPPYTALTIGVLNQRVTQYNRAHPDSPYLVYVWRNTGEAQVHKLPRRKADGTFGGQLTAAQSYSHAELQALFDAQGNRGKAAKMRKSRKPVQAEAVEAVQAEAVQAEAVQAEAEAVTA